MQRFILQQNTARFRGLLAEPQDEASRRTLTGLLAAAQRDLAILNSTQFGVVTDDAPLGVSRRQVSCDPHLAQRFQREFETASDPFLLLDPGPGLHIVDTTEAYAHATMTTRAGIAGGRMFEVFPDNPDDAAADGVSNLYASLQLAVETGEPHTMQSQRYDVRDAGGRFVERYWRSVNTPLFDDQNRLIYLIHHVEDVTDEVLSPVVRQSDARTGELASMG
jgi:PAS domain-containing protein